MGEWKAPELNIKFVGYATTNNPDQFQSIPINANFGFFTKDNLKIVRARAARIILCQVDNNKR